MMTSAYMFFWTVLQTVAIIFDKLLSTVICLRLFCLQIFRNYIDTTDCILIRLQLNNVLLLKQTVHEDCPRLYFQTYYC